MATTTITRVSAAPPWALSQDTIWNDWRDDLRDNGFVVIPGVLSPDKARSYQKQALDWMGSFSDHFNIQDRQTWTRDNLPAQSPHNLLRGYGVEHEKFMWDARMEPGVVDKFAKLWGTDQLLVSFDALNVTLPHRPGREGPAPAWPHVDQSPLRRGLACVQGILNLSEAGAEDGGLLVYPGTHKLMDAFFDTQLDQALWKPDDFFPFSSAQMAWFAARGAQPHKVCARPGDLILWDSRTIHMGCEPTPASDTVRTVIYVAYTPAAMAKPEALALKAQLFQDWKGTTHWPHQIFSNQGALYEDGTRDPRAETDRKEPLQKPELTKKLLQYAGVEPY